MSPPARDGAASSWATKCSPGDPQRSQSGEPSALHHSPPWNSTQPRETSSPLYWKTAAHGAPLTVVRPGGRKPVKAREGAPPDGADGGGAGWRGIGSRRGSRALAGSFLASRVSVPSAPVSDPEAAGFSASTAAPNAGSSRKGKAPPSATPTGLPSGDRVRRAGAAGASWPRSASAARASAADSTSAAPSAAELLSSCSSLSDFKKFLASKDSLVKCGSYNSSRF